MSQLFAYIEQYHVPVTPERVFHLEEIVAAHQYVESSEGYGKVVVVNWQIDSLANWQIDSLAIW